VQAASCGLDGVDLRSALLTWIKCEGGAPPTSVTRHPQTGEILMNNGSGVVSYGLSNLLAVSSIDKPPSQGRYYISWSRALPPY
jgi:hypothetical protein